MATEPHPSPGAAFEWLSLAGKVGAISALIGAWLFLVGWSWAYFWFGQFGVGISGLEIDNRAMPLWGLVAVRAFWWQTALAVLGALGVAALATRFRVPPDLIVLGIVLFVLAATAAGFKLGQVKATSDYAFMARENWPGKVPVRLTLSPGARQDETLAAIAEDALTGCWRVLYYDGRSVYVFRPLRDQPGLRFPVRLIERSALMSMQLGPVGLPVCSR